MALIIDGVKIKSLADVDDYLARLLDGQDISKFENPYKDEPNQSDDGVSFRASYEETPMHTLSLISQA